MVRAVLARQSRYVGPGVVQDRRSLSISSIKASTHYQGTVTQEPAEPPHADFLNRVFVHSDLIPLVQLERLVCRLCRHQLGLLSAPINPVMAAYSVCMLPWLAVALFVPPKLGHQVPFRRFGLAFALARLGLVDGLVPCQVPVESVDHLAMLLRGLECLRVQADRILRTTCARHIGATDQL